MSFSLKQLDKSALLIELRQQLDDNLATLMRRQEDTQRAATHEENRPEHSKDTRATEQSYLARGLAARVGDLRQAAGQLAKIESRTFDSSQSVSLMAVVAIRVEDETDSTFWWLVPAAGGLEVLHEEIPIRTLTPAAPLGRALMGLHVGDGESFATPRGRRSFELVDIA